MDRRNAGAMVVFVPAINETCCFSLREDPLASLAGRFGGGI